MALPRLLLVDDDLPQVAALRAALAVDHQVTAVSSPCAALTWLAEYPRAAVVLVSLGLGPAEGRPNTGFRLLAELRLRYATLPIVLLAEADHPAWRRRARALGAREFLVKPGAQPALAALLRAACRAGPAPARTAVDDDLPGLIGDSDRMRALKAEIDLAATARCPVLIVGESGTGKEQVAHALHALSARAEHPWLAINCAAITPALAEATLFGHARGAFSGAVTEGEGFFAAARDGTLFLDEIGELPLDVQAKLLRVLESGDFVRVGETRARLSNARVVAATHRSLAEEVVARRFRADLYHRLATFKLAVPALRELGPDRRRLFDHLRESIAAAERVPPFALAEQGYAALERYRFPGNVRELRNIAYRLTLRHAGREIDAATLCREFEPEAAAPEPQADTDWPARARHELTQEPFSLDAALDGIQRVYIEQAVALAQGNMALAARLLGIGRTTLYARLAGRAATPRHPTRALRRSSHEPGSEGPNESKR